MFLYINMLWKHFNAEQYPPVKSSDTETKSKQCNAETTNVVGTVLGKAQVICSSSHVLQWERKERMKL